MKKFATGAATAAALLTVLAVTVRSQEPRLAGERTDQSPENPQVEQSQPIERQDATERRGVQTRETRKVAPQQSREREPAQHEHEATQKPTKAVAVLFPIADSGVSGLLTIEAEGRRVTITGAVRGLEPNSKHGFHIHQFGDLSDLKKGQSVGGHFDPDGTHKHGRQDAPREERHVGDLGNIEANDEGVAEIRIEDELVTLHGAHSVIGRAFVVHEQEDTFAQPSGDAGGRIAFGTIGIAKAK